MKTALIALGVTAAAILSTGAASAQAPRSAQQCFRASDWRGWKATPDGQSMYVDTGINRTYRMDFVQPCAELNALGATLLQFTDRAYICRPIDVNIRVVRPGLSTTYCQVSRITRLTPAQSKALPRAVRP